MKKEKLNLWLGMLIAALNYKIIKVFRNDIVLRKHLITSLIVLGSIMLGVAGLKIDIPQPHQKDLAISEIAKTAKLEPLQSITLKNPPMMKEVTATDAETANLEVTATDAETSKIEVTATDAETQAETEISSEIKTEASTEKFWQEDTQFETEQEAEASSVDQGTHYQEDLLFPPFLDIAKIKEANINLEDLYWLAHLIYAENGSNSYRCQLYTGLVVINRVLSKEYPISVKDIIFSKGQYSTVSEGIIYEEPSEQAWQIAWDILLGNTEKIPANVVYQAMFVQGDGIFAEIDGEYFCYE